MGESLTYIQALAPWLTASVALISGALIFHQAQRTRELQLESMMLKTLLDHITSRSYPENDGRAGLLEFWKWSAANVIALATIERFSASVGWWSKANSRTQKYILDLADLIMEDREHMKTGMAELLKRSHTEEPTNA